MTVTNLSVDHLTAAAVTIGSCTSFSGGGTPANCTNSEVQIYDISISGLTGSSETDTVASLQCSAVRPCYNIAIEDVDLTLTSDSSSAPTEYLCSEVVDQVGFNCTGSACEESSATGQC